MGSFEHLTLARDGEAWVGRGPEGEEGEMHRARPGADREHMLDLEVLGHPLLQLRGARACGQPAGAEGLGDRGDLLVADRRRLEAQLGVTARPHRPGSVRRPPHGGRRRPDFGVASEELN